MKVHSIFLCKGYLLSISGRGGLCFTPDLLHLWVLVMASHVPTHVTNMTVVIWGALRGTACALRIHNNPLSEKPTLFLERTSLLPARLGSKFVARLSAWLTNLLKYVPEYSWVCPSLSSCCLNACGVLCFAVCFCLCIALHLCGAVCTDWFDCTGAWQPLSCTCTA